MGHSVQASSNRCQKHPSNPGVLLICGIALFQSGIPDCCARRTRPSASKNGLRGIPGSARRQDGQTTNAEGADTTHAGSAATAWGRGCILHPSRDAAWASRRTCADTQVQQSNEPVRNSGRLGCAPWSQPAHRHSSPKRDLRHQHAAPRADTDARRVLSAPSVPLRHPGSCSHLTAALPASRAAIPVRSSLARRTSTQTRDAMQSCGVRVAAVRLVEP